MNKKASALLLVTFLTSAAIPYSSADAQTASAPATQQAGATQQVQRHPAIKIPVELKVVKMSTNEVITIPPGTSIELPYNARGADGNVNIRTLKRGWKTDKGQDMVGQSTFMYPNASGRFPIPSEAVFILGGNGQRRQLSDLAFYAPAGTDIIQVIPAIKYRRDQQAGMLFPLDADLLFVQGNAISETPAFIGLYHPLADQTGLSAQMIATVEQMHRDKRPATTDNEIQNMNFFKNHIGVYHEVTGPMIQMGVYEATAIQLARAPGSSPNPPSQ